MKMSAVSRTLLPPKSLATADKTLFAHSAITYGMHIAFRNVPFIIIAWSHF